MEKRVDQDKAMRYPRYALVSVSNKTGIENLARALCDFGFEILSTGGTGQALKEAGVPVTDISELTGFDQILDGAVKSLHPQVIGGIVARDSQQHFEELVSMKSSYVDIVICNLGRVAKPATAPTAPLSNVMDQIDIGGPTLLKAAAKNFERVTVISDPEIYHDLLWYLASEGEVPLETRFEWAKQAFKHVKNYESMIYTTLLEYDLATDKRK